MGPDINPLLSGPLVRPGSVAVVDGDVDGRQDPVERAVGLGRRNLGHGAVPDPGSWCWGTRDVAVARVLADLDHDVHDLQERIRVNLKKMLKCLNEPKSKLSIRTSQLLA